MQCTFSQKKFPVQLTFPLSQEQQLHFPAAHQPRFVGEGIPVTLAPLSPAWDANWGPGWKREPEVSTATGIKWWLESRWAYLETKYTNKQILIWYSHVCNANLSALSNQFTAYVTLSNALHSTARSDCLTSSVTLTWDIPQIRPQLGTSYCLYHTLKCHTFQW